MQDKNTYITQIHNFHHGKLDNRASQYKIYETQNLWDICEI